MCTAATIAVIWKILSYCAAVQSPLCSSLLPAISSSITIQPCVNALVAFRVCYAYAQHVRIHAEGGKIYCEKVKAYIKFMLKKLFGGTCSNAANFVLEDVVEVATHKKITNLSR